MIKVKRLHDIGRRRFLGVAAGALATAQAVTIKSPRRGRSWRHLSETRSLRRILCFRPKQIDTGVVNVGYAETLLLAVNGRLLSVFSLRFRFRDSPYGTILDSATRLILSFVFTDIQGSTAFATHTAPPRDRVWPEIR